MQMLQNYPWPGNVRELKHAVESALITAHGKKLIMEELVLRLYEQGIITSAHGASLLKKDRISFERFLAENELSIHGEPEGLHGDVTNLQRIL